MGSTFIDVYSAIPLILMSLREMDDRSCLFLKLLPPKFWLASRLPVSAIASTSQFNDRLFIRLACET